MSLLDNKSEFRIFVKILFAESGTAAMAEVHYFRNDMTVPFYQKWRWYFEYRAALLRVKYPKSFIGYEQGSYIYELPENMYKDKVKNIYFSNKRQFCKFNNRLNALKQNWNEIFPIEEHPDYIKIMDKKAYYQKQLNESKKLYDSLFEKLPK